MTAPTNVLSPGGFIEVRGVSGREVLHVITVTSTQINVEASMGKVYVCECVCMCGVTLNPVGTAKVGKCMFFSPFTHLLTTTTPFTPYTHIYTLYTEVVRVQSRVHKDPSELNKLAPFQGISHLCCTAHNSLRALLTLNTHRHSYTHICGKYKLIYCVPSKTTVLALPRRTKQHFKTLF